MRKEIEAVLAMCIILQVIPVAPVSICRHPPLKELASNMNVEHGVLY